MKRLRVPRHRQPLLLRGFRANVQDRTFPITPFYQELTLVLLLASRIPRGHI